MAEAEGREARSDPTETAAADEDLGLPLLVHRLHPFENVLQFYCWRVKIGSVYC